MPERIEWLDDGTESGAPYSPRFGDRYRSELGGLEQAREVFLAGCDLPGSWSHQPHWRILETGFGLGLNFLVTWAAWKADASRPKMLHFVSTEAYPASAADVLRSASGHPVLLPLALQLQAQLWGLLPGIHRLVFEGGHVLLTLCIGDAKVMLRQQRFEADSVYLDGFSPPRNPDLWDVHTFKAVARCCRRGTRIATWTVARNVRDALAQCGFVVQKTTGIPPKRDNLQGEYNPAWEPKTPSHHTATSPRTPTTCVVVGAGLAGAAVASSLARRGWQVVVLDAASAPASGASGLPAGLLAPHVSPDDSQLSRLSRSGMRLTLQQADALLRRGWDWAQTGVMEYREKGSVASLPSTWAQSWPDAAADWSHPATSAQLAGAGLNATDTALWHSRACWIKPAALVHAWLEQSGATWLGHAKAASLTGTPVGWQVRDVSGNVLAEAAMVVIAAASSSPALAATVNPQMLSLMPVRGQLTWGHHQAGEQGLPSFPINGHGSLLPAVPGPAGPRWMVGSSYQRGDEDLTIRPADTENNLARLQALLPETAPTLVGALGTEKIQGWTGIRCATPSRLPALGCIATSASGAQVWVCSGMGSRGLSFAALCAELLAAQLHGEPLPMEYQLSQALLPTLVPAPGTADLARVIAAAASTG